jgi:hypothetical protein
MLPGCALCNLRRGGLCGPSMGILGERSATPRRVNDLLRNLDVAAFLAAPPARSAELITACLAQWGATNGDKVMLLATGHFSLAG